MTLYWVDNPYSCAGYYLIQAKDLSEAIIKAQQQLNLIKFKGETGDIVASIREVQFNERGVSADISQVG